MSAKVRVLIVDDSMVYRSQIRKALELMPEVEVLGASSSGKLALEFLAVKPVDLVLLDLEMPELNGFETLKKMKENKCQSTVLVFSSHSVRGAEMTLEALRLGAADFVPKPSVESIVGSEPHQYIHDLLAPKVRALFPAKKASVVTESPQIAPLKTDLRHLHPEILLIGSSTGGPTVLENLLGQLDVELRCPVVIAQHMPPLFTKTFAERLGKLSGRPSHEATDGLVLEPNHIYVAPGDYHLTLAQEADRVVCRLDQKEKIHSVRPAVDPLFQSASRIYGRKALALVLTGMGFDGRDGALEVKKQGGGVVIQDEKSCVVFGMPGAVFQAKAFDQILSPIEIKKLIIEQCGRSRLSTLTRQGA